MTDEKFKEFVGVVEKKLKQWEEASNGVLKRKTEALVEIRKNYAACRDQMKMRMALIDPAKKSWENQRLDRHKIAAALCWAIVRAVPLDTSKARTANDRAANETVAFTAPLSILMSFAADDARKAGNPTLAGYFDKGPALPVTSDDVSFAVHVTRCLYWHRHRNKEAPPEIDKWLDPFQLAIMFYLLEFFASLKGEMESGACP
jgi:hypothetical protein